MTMSSSSRSEAGGEARDGSFPVSGFEAVLRAFLAANKTTRAVDALLQKYILAHLDLLHFFLAFLSNVFRNDKVFDHGLFFDLLQKTGTFLMGEALLEETSIEGEEDLPLFFPELSKKQFKLKKQYTKCWLDLLKNFDPQTKCSELRKLAAGAATTTSASIAKLNDKQRSQLFAAKTDRLKKKTMLHLTNIFQYLQNPLVLADFFLAEFDRGSLEVQICALSGLLYLTTQTKLEFQDDYYERLYLLVRPEAFEVEYRVRFQRILASSLILSTSLPGVSAACFAKKLLRICVGAGGGASGAKNANSAKSGAAAVVDVPTICWCLALCFNIVRKNEATCKRLLHRGGTGRGSKNKGKVAAAEDLHEDKVEVLEIMNSQTTTDPFDVSASLPASRQSVKQSCLWELEALSKHHHPLVARLVPFFRNPNMFKKIAQGIDANEFLDVSVDELLEKELKNKRKQYDDLIVRSEMNSGGEDHEMPGFAPSTLCPC
eukprot:g1243.t1